MAASAGPLAILRGSALAVFASAILWAWAYPATADTLGRVDIGASAPAFTAMGADGRPHSLSDYAGRIVVLEWTSPVCPFTAIEYRSGAMQALQRRAARHGAVWLSIDTSAPGRPGYLSAEAANKRVARLHATVTAFLSDPDGRIGRAYGAKATPQFFMIDRVGKLAYQGSMHGQDTGRPPRTRGAARAALDDLTNGRPVAVPETPPYGCPVEY